VAHHPVPDHAPHVGTHGNPDGFLTLADALERSCNVYFETLGHKLGTQGLSYWSRHWGLGRETGLGIPEARGHLPDQIRSHNPSDAWFSAIGQGGVLATPVQMANVAATLARDGVWVRPRLIEGENIDLSPVKPRDKERIPDTVVLPLSKEALAAAREGMTRVVNGRAGTGGAARMTEFIVAGKTGTAQASKIFDPKRDDEGRIIYLNANDKRVDVDGTGYIVARDHSGKFHRVDAQGNLLVLNEEKQYQRLDDLGRIVPLVEVEEMVHEGGKMVPRKKREVIRPVKGRTIPIERPLATADVETPWPWYRGWGEKGNEVNHGWFIGFAPADDPQVAFAVMIEYANSGGLAAEAAHKVLQKCIERGYIKPGP
jgi:cell division protein FtsI/penicillin-binding protein 2